MGTWLAPPLWEVRYARFDEGNVAERAEEWRVTIDGEGKIRQVQHRLPEQRPGVRLSRDDARALAQREIQQRFGLDTVALREVSAEQEQRPARSDWQFTYTDPSVDVGPMIDKGALERVDAWVKEAVEQGAEVLTGGKREDPLYYPTVLAGKGYAVLRPNYRGSIGYGPAFARDVVNGYFRNMAPDIMAGVDHLIQKGIADPDRLVAMGWSAGGTLVNKLVTMTDRFKVASAGAAISNWTSLYGQTDNTSFRRTWFGGTPWQKNARMDLFWNNSPLKDVANVKTPVLLFAGESDTRVPMAQSIEMYRALRSNGVPTVLDIAPREPHLWGDLRHLLFKANTELEWFEKYAMGRTYVWEKAPDGSKPGSH